MTNPRAAEQQLLNMTWANEPGVAVYVFSAENPRGETDERRVIQIRKGDVILASATIELHNHDSLANSISPYLSPFGLAQR